MAVLTAADVANLLFPSGSHDSCRYTVATKATRQALASLNSEKRDHS